MRIRNILVVLNKEPLLNALYNGEPAIALKGVRIIGSTADSIIAEVKCDSYIEVEPDIERVQKFKQILNQEI